MSYEGPTAFLVAVLAGIFFSPDTAFLMAAITLVTLSLDKEAS